MQVHQAYLGTFSLQIQQAASSISQNVLLQDCFDVKGHCTGNGSPAWLASHPPADKHAAAVQVRTHFPAEVMPPLQPAPINLSSHNSACRLGTVICQFVHADRHHAHQPRRCRWWRRAQTPVLPRTPARQALLDAGATVVGKNVMDEMAYSLAGENAHYGTPVNPAAPGRIPGGSSSGTAAAVAAGDADIGLGERPAG